MLSEEIRTGAVRVLHVGKHFPPDHGGIEVFLADLMYAQRNAGTEAHAIVHGAPRADDPEWLRRVPVHARLVFAPIAPGFWLALHRAIRDFRPDVLHLHLPNLSALWALLLPAARQLHWVVHWHADVVASAKRRRLAWAYRCYRPFEQAILARADRIIATSPPYLEASEPLSRWREKCCVVPLGIDARRLPAPKARQHKRRGAHFRIAAVGRLTYYKGFETLIEAVAELDDVELDIIGEGEERAALEDLLANLGAAAGRIRLRGALDDAHKFALITACDLFCMPSRERTEAFGMALLEAMALARPCLVTDLPGSGMPWLINCADGGALARIDDAVDWRRAIEALRRDPTARERFGRNGRAALDAHFTMEKIEAKISRIYPVERVAADPQSRRTLIVIPARDEAATIGPLVDSLRRSGWSEVVVINDQSLDDTPRAAARAGAIVLNPALRVGAWGAVQTGIRYALRHGFSEVVSMDADGQHEVPEISKLLAQRTHADVVIGANPERGTIARRLAWAWFRRITGFGLADLTSGFRYYGRPAIEVLAEPEATLLDYQDVGVLLILRRAGMRIAEVPVRMNPRQAGKSRVFHSWPTVARYMAETTLLCLSRWRPRRCRLPS